MHKRRKRGLSKLELSRLTATLQPGADEYEESITREQEQRLRWRVWWDTTYPDGEGVTNAGVLYQWVRVTCGRGKVLGTFYLEQADGELVGLSLVTPRKGLPPNPYDETFLSTTGWARQDMSQTASAVPNGDSRPAPGRDAREAAAHSGLWDAHGNSGQRPVLGVVPVLSTDQDTRFKFQAGKDGFTVRGSKLGAVLLGFRRAGYQHVTLEQVRAALHHLA